MPFPYEEFNLSDVRTYPLASRRSKARVEDFGRPVGRGASFKTWFDSLPGILGGRDVRRVVDAIVSARRGGAGIIWGLGAHVIKTGVSPVLIDLMQRGYVSAIAMNGAGIIHDGNPMLGAAGYAGEAGHTLINPDGQACRCGAIGLLVCRNSVQSSGSRESWRCCWSWWPA